MKRILLPAILLLCGVGSRAQLYPVSFEEKFAASTLVAEGRVVSQYCFWDATHAMIYTASQVVLSKIFTGSSVRDTVEVMTVGGIVGLEAVVPSELLQLQAGQQGVFFLQPDALRRKSPRSGALVYDVYSSAQGFLMYDPARRSAAAPFAFYPAVSGALYTDLQNAAGHPYTVVGGPGVAEQIVAQKATGSITSFTPTTVWAGAHATPSMNTLVISGSGFGTASGSAAVLFPNCDNGGTGTISVPYSSALIGASNWSSTQVTVRVPQNAGTGSIQIMDNTGAVVATSSTSLIVDFAVMTVDFGAGVSNGPEEINLMNANGAGGYTLTYSTSTAGGGVDFTSAGAQPSRDAFERALATHKEVIGFNVVVSNTTTTSQAVLATDGLNIVQLDNTNTGQGVLAAGVLAVCYSYYTKCSSTTFAAQKRGFDVTIRNAGVSTGSITFATGPCPPGAGNYDLESVLLHELGHAENHNHVIEAPVGPSATRNPGAVMHYAIAANAKRSSPDYPLLRGGQYEVTPSGFSYGSCGLPTSEMTPLTTTIAQGDECSAVSFGTTLSPATTVAFDLAHATSNRYTDPQATAVQTTATITGVTNTQYFAFKTRNRANSTVTMTIANYATTPAAQAACSNTGVELSLYQASSCPAGGSFPTPVAYQTFNSNGALTAITGLSANTSYLLMADGIENTKASFTMSFAGTALPVRIQSFDGIAEASDNLLRWTVSPDPSMKELQLQRSTDGIAFTTLAVYAAGDATASAGLFRDGAFVQGGNFYRLAAVATDGSPSYSNTVSLDRAQSSSIWLAPNPARGKVSLNVHCNSATSVSATISDVRGTVISRTAYDAVAGQNSWSLPLEFLPPGYYNVTVFAGGAREVLRLIRE